MLSGLDGGLYQQGFLSGAGGFIVSSVVIGLVISNIPRMRGISTVAAGGISTGIIRKASGGNFWQGFRMGAITAVLNHMRHQLQIGYKTGRYFNRKPYHTKDQEFWNDTITMKEWLENNKGKTLHHLCNEREPSNGLPEGPFERYAIHPISGNVMDLRHVFVVGYRWFVESIGNLAEYVHWSGGVLGFSSGGSAFHQQEYYSNKIGANFYYYVTGNFLNNIVYRNVAPYFTECLHTNKIEGYYD